MDCNAKEKRGYKNSSRVSKTKETIVMITDVSVYNKALINIILAQEKKHRPSSYF